MDLDKEQDPSQGNFPIYIASGRRLIRIDIDKMATGGLAPGYLELVSETIQAITVAGGNIFVATDTARIIRISPDSPALWSPCE